MISKLLRVISRDDVATFTELITTAVPFVDEIAHDHPLGDLTLQYRLDLEQVANRFVSTEVEQRTASIYKLTDESDSVLFQRFRIRCTSA